MTVRHMACSLLPALNRRHSSGVAGSSLILLSPVTGGTPQADVGLLILSRGCQHGPGRLQIYMGERGLTGEGTQERALSRTGLSETELRRIYWRTTHGQSFPPLAQLAVSMFTRVPVTTSDAQPDLS